MDLKLEYTEYPEPKRNYKDSVFRLSFSEKRYLLDLYNSLNHTDYDNPEDLEINTLENAIYLSMKNDVSFLFDCTLNLYEHQSTYNPNMPLRGLFYISRLFEKLVVSRNINIYSSSLQKIPTPRYVVFYNGMQEEPDEKILYLSDAFEKSNGCLECEVLMLNINYGRNMELMEKCKRLKDYAYFIYRIRTLLDEGCLMEIAVNRAVDECIEKDILKDILIAQRSEVLDVILSTFNKELYEQDIRDDAYSKGKVAGRQEGKLEKTLEMVKKKLKKGKTAEIIADEIEESLEYVHQLITEYISDK